MDSKKRAIVTDRTGPTQGVASSSGSSRVEPLLGAQFIGAAAWAAQLPDAGPAEIAFAGRSNAGKSSAINALARRTRLAFASRTPGRTQQINFFELRNGARVADLPGYGYSSAPQSVKRTWQDFLWAYVTTRSTLVGLVLVVDARHGLKQLDTELLDGFVPSGRSTLVLASKADKLNTSDRRDAVASIRRALEARFAAHMQAISVVPFSATQRMGIESADAVIDAWLPTPDRD